MISKKGVKHGPPLRPLLSRAPPRFFLASVHALGFCFPSLVFFTLICLYFELCPVNTPPPPRSSSRNSFAFCLWIRGASRPEKERKKKKQTTFQLFLSMFPKTNLHFNKQSCMLTKNIECFSFNYIFEFNTYLCSNKK